MRAATNNLKSNGRPAGRRDTYCTLTVYSTVGCLCCSCNWRRRVCGPLKKYSSSTVQCTSPEHTIKLSCCAAERALRMKRLSRVELRLRLRPRRLRSPEMGTAAADISPFCGRANWFRARRGEGHSSRVRPAPALLLEVWVQCEWVCSSTATGKADGLGQWARGRRAKGTARIESSAASAAPLASTDESSEDSQRRHSFVHSTYRTAQRTTVRQRGTPRKFPSCGEEWAARYVWFATITTVESSRVESRNGKSSRMTSDRESAVSVDWRGEERWEVQLRFRLAWVVLKRRLMEIADYPLVSFALSEVPRNYSSKL